MFSVAAAGRFELHAQLFIFHKGSLFLRTLFFQLCLQTVDLGFELRDVTLSLQEEKET